MRIGFLHQSNDPYTLVRIKYFLQKGHDVYSVVFYSKQEPIQLPGITIISLPYNPLIRLPFVKRIIYAGAIRKITHKYDFDVFYIVSALNSYYLKSSKSILNFLEIQGSDVITAPRKFPLLKLFYRVLWKYADGITQDSLLAKEKGKPYMPSNVLNETVEIGVDFNVFNQNVKEGIIRKKYNLGNRPIVFHSRGVTKLYNLNTIMKSIPLVKKFSPDVCYMFTGNFELLESETKAFIKKNHLTDNIIFCGRLDHESEMKYYYKDANLMISIPSSDSSPFSVYEAMAMKIPVIVSDLPWFKDKFTSYVDLISVTIGDVSLLSEATIKLLNNDIALNLEHAQLVVKNKINMEDENRRLEKMFLSLKTKKNI